MGVERSDPHRGGPEGTDPGGGGPGEGSYWSQRDAARAYTRLAETSEVLFAAAGRLSTDRARPHGERIAWATLSRLLGVQARRWAELVPESVLLEPDRAVPEVPAPVSAGEVRHAVGAHLAELAAISAQLSPVADGAAMRVIRQARVELAPPATRIGVSARA